MGSGIGDIGSMIESAMGDLGGGGSGGGGGLSGLLGGGGSGGGLSGLLGGLDPLSGIANSVGGMLEKMGLPPELVDAAKVAGGCMTGDVCLAADGAAGELGDLSKDASAQPATTEMPAEQETQRPQGYREKVIVPAEQDDDDGSDVDVQVKTTGDDADVNVDVDVDVDGTNVDVQTPAGGDVNVNVDTDGDHGAGRSEGNGAPVVVRAQPQGVDTGYQDSRPAQRPHDDGGQTDVNVQTGGSQGCGDDGEDYSFLNDPSMSLESKVEMLMDCLGTQINNAIDAQMQNVANAQSSQASNTTSQGNTGSSGAGGQSAGQGTSGSQPTSGGQSSGASSSDANTNLQEQMQQLQDLTSLRSQMFTMVSNVEKSLSDTSMTILRNIGQ